MTLLTWTPHVHAKPHEGMVRVDANEAWWRERLEHPKVGRKGGPAIFGCLFKEGSQNKDFNHVEVCNAVVLDFDFPDLTQQDTLKKFICRVITYSTYSATASLKKFRFVLPLKDPIKPTQYEALWSLVDKELGEKSDTSTKDATRLSFLPRLASEEARAFYSYHYQDGELFDWRDHFGIDDLPEAAPYIARTEGMTPGRPEGWERPHWWPSATDDDVAYRARKYFEQRGDGICAGERHITLMRTGCELWWDWALERELVAEILHDINERFSPPKTARDVEYEVNASWQRCLGQHAVPQANEYGHFMGAPGVDAPGVIRDLLASSEQKRTVAESPVMAHGDQPPDYDPPLFPSYDDDDDAPRAPAIITQDDDRFPEELLQVGGLAGDIANWIERCAIRPAPILSFGAALALMGTITGRTYETKSHLRTNIYVVGVAPTGAGKEIGRQCLMSLLRKADLSSFVGTGDLASSAGFLRLLSDFPIRLFPLDEFGAMLKAFSSPKASNFERAIITMMMKLTSSANGTYPRTAYVEKDNEDIVHPHAVIWATTAPDRFYDSLGGADVVDGFLNRLIVLETTRGRLRRTVPDDHNEPPQGIVERVKAIGDARHLAGPGTGGNIQQVFHSSTVGFSELKVATEDDGARRQQDHLLEEIERGLDSKSPDMWARVYEHTMKLALIRSISRDFMSPSITGDDVLWASSIILWQTKRFIRIIGERVAENDAHKMKQEILKAIRAYGPGAHVSKSEIARKAQTIKKSDRDSTLNDLIESGAITTEKVQTTGRPRELYWITADMQ